MQIKSFSLNDNLSDFLNVPRRIYRDVAHYPVRLDFEMREHLSKKNPYFDHANICFFVAYDDQANPCGRISAQINDLSKDGEGHFGYVDADSPQTLAALIGRAEEWLLEQGARSAVGPFSLSINDESGLLTEGFDLAPRILMNYARDWYADVIEDKGYQGVQNLLAYDMDVTLPLPGSARYMAKQADQMDNLIERQINMKDFTADIELVVDIFNDAWSDNWGFIPMTEQEVKVMAHNLKPVIDPRLARLVYVDDEAAGMIVALPDVNEAIHDLNGKLLPLGFAKLLWRLKVKGLSTGRILLMGVRQKYHGSPLASAISAHLIQSLHTQCGHAGIKTLELSWILEDNKPTRRLAEMCGGKVTRSYRMYSKELTQTSDLLSGAA